MLNWISLNVKGCCKPFSISFPNTLYIFSKIYSINPQSIELMATSTVWSDKTDCFSHIIAFAMFWCLSIKSHIPYAIESLIVSLISLLWRQTYGLLRFKVNKALRYAQSHSVSAFFFHPSLLLSLCSTHTH